MEDKENEIDNKNLETYRMLYLQSITQSYHWFQEQSPYLWLAFQKTIYTSIRIEEYKQEIKKYEEQIKQLDLEIKQSTRIVAGEEAVLGWAGKNPVLASAIDNLQKVGLSTVPIVTLFTIAGVGSILNPFADAGQRWGVIFLLWSSVAFILLTSSGIIKLTHRLSKKHWQQTFLKVEIRIWFVFGCLLFGLIEGIGGGSLAANLLDRITQEGIKSGELTLDSLLKDDQKIKITAILSLFAYLNIFFSIAKGKEIRILQPSKIRRGRAAKALENAIENRKELMGKINDPVDGFLAKIKNLEGKIEFDITLQEEETEVRDLSNANTLGRSFIDKHPGTYKEDTPTPTPISNGNGHTTNGVSEVRDEIKNFEL
jgi:hypothetical protein